MNAVTSWSFSAWEQFTLCPAQYKYQRIDKLPTEDKPFFAKGRAAHTHLEKAVMGEPLDSAIVPKEQQIVRELCDLKAPLKMTERQWGFDSMWRETGWHDAWLRVIADVFVSYGDGTGEIIDWKTGSKRDEGRSQMHLLATATFHKYHSLNYITTRLVYVEKGGQSIMDHSRDNLDEMTLGWEDEAAKMMAEREFAPRPNAKCQWCDFRRSNKGPCRYG